MVSLVISRDQRRFQEEMSDAERSNSQLMRRMVDMFNTGDLPTVESPVSPDYIDHQGIGGSKMYGPKGFADVVTQFRQARPRLRVTVETLTANGDHVEAKLFWCEPGPIDTSDSRCAYEKRTIEIVRFANGQAVEHWGRQLD